MHCTALRCHTGAGHACITGSTRAEGSCTITCYASGASFAWQDGDAETLPSNSQLISGSKVLAVLEPGDAATLPISKQAFYAWKLGAGEDVSPAERAEQLYSTKRTIDPAGHLQPCGWDKLVQCLLVRCVPRCHQACVGSVEVRECLCVDLVCVCNT